MPLKAANPKHQRPVTPEILERFNPMLPGTKSKALPAKVRKTKKSGRLVAKTSCANCGQEWCIHAGTGGPKEVNKRSAPSCNLWVQNGRSATEVAE